MYISRARLLAGRALWLIVCMGSASVAQQGTVAGGATAVPLPCAQPGPWRFVMDASNVYWTDFLAGNVLRAPVAGSRVEIIATKQGGPCGITVDQTAIYWTNNKDGKIMRLSKQGGKPSTVASGQDRPAAISVNDNVVYCSIGVDTVKKFLFRASSDITTSIKQNLKGNDVKTASFVQDASGHTVHCDSCPDYCTRTVCDTNSCHDERYICGWHACNCR